MIPIMKGAKFMKTIKEDANDSKFMYWRKCKFPFHPSNFPPLIIQSKMSKESLYMSSSEVSPTECALTTKRMYTSLLYKCAITASPYLNKIFNKKINCYLFDPRRK